VFASPPFDITSAIMRRLTTAEVPPRAAYLALQREAVDRYLGRPRQTLAALLLAPWVLGADHSPVCSSDFSPPPAVDIVMVRMQKRGPPLIDPVTRGRTAISSSPSLSPESRASALSRHSSSAAESPDDFSMPRKSIRPRPLQQ